MTVSQTEMMTILARLQTIEERQNLLKNNLLSLKEQVTSLQLAFEERPEKDQLDVIQAQLTALESFGDRLVNPTTLSDLASTTINGDRPKNNVDPVMLLMPLRDEDLELESHLTDLSSLGNALESDNFSDNFAALDLDDMAFMEEMSLEDLDEFDDDSTAFDVEMNIDTLDLDMLDLENLENNIDTSSEDMGALQGISDTNLAQLETIDLEGIDFDETESFEIDTLDVLQLGEIRQNTFTNLKNETTDLTAMHDLLALDDTGTNPEYFETTLDLDDDLSGDSSDLEPFDFARDYDDLEMSDLLDQELAAIDDASLEMDSLDLTDDTSAADSFDFEAESGTVETDDDLLDQELAEMDGADLEIGSLDLTDETLADVSEELTQLDATDAFDFESESAAMEMDELLNPELVGMDETALEMESFDAIDEAALGEMSELNGADDFGDLDFDQLEMELAADQPNDEGMVDFVEDDISPETVTMPESVTLAEDLDASDMEEIESAPIAIESIESIESIEPVKSTEEHLVLDTEDPEERQTAEEFTPDITATEILTRLGDRQHNFSGLRLSHLNLPQQNLRDCVFDDCQLVGSNFQSSDLRDTSFKGANLQNADLQYTSLERANLEQANLQGAQFQGMLFNGATNFKGANLQQASFRGLDFSRPPMFAGANLQGTDFTGVNFRGASLAGWNLSGAKLHRANLIEANLKEANLDNADLTGAIYSPKTAFPVGFKPVGAFCLKPEANLQGADLNHLDLRRLDLTKANLSGANLELANLCGCDFSDANLSGANLRRSQLRATCLEANFSGANLTQADLREANFTASHFKNADLQGAILKNANFTATDLRGVKLQGSDTYHTNFNGANLQGINLSGVNFEGDLSGANLSEAQLQNMNLNYLDLSWANLTDADVTGATFKETNLDHANLRNAKGFKLSEYDYKVYLKNAVLPDGKTPD